MKCNLIKLGLVSVFGLISCENKFSKVDKCREIQKSASNLAANASIYYRKNGKWPPNLTALGEQIRLSNSNWESFSGGAKNWNVDVIKGDRFQITYLGLDAYSCAKVFVFNSPVGAYGASPARVGQE